MLNTNQRKELSRFCRAMMGNDFVKVEVGPYTKHWNFDFDLVHVAIHTTDTVVKCRIPVKVAHGLDMK